MVRIAAILIFVAGCAAPYRITHVASAPGSGGEAWFLEAGTYSDHSELHVVHCTPEPRRCERFAVEGGPKRKAPGGGAGASFDVGF